MAKFGFLKTPTRAEAEEMIRRFEAKFPQLAVVARRRRAVTEPYDVWWHMEYTEGQQMIVVRVPQCENRVTQGETFDQVKTSVQELVAVWNESTLKPAEVTVGPFHEESEADFLEATK